jgi:hypothetical protein
MREDQALKKTYKPFVAWILLFLPVLFGILYAFRPFLSSAGETRVMMAAIVLYLDGLLYLMYRYEAVYWISGGPDFEEARAADASRRKAYIAAHARKFLIATGGYLLYLVCSALAGCPTVVDVIVGCAVVTGAAVLTMRIRF